MTLKQFETLNTLSLIIDEIFDDLMSTHEGRMKFYSLLKESGKQRKGRIKKRRRKSKKNLKDWIKKGRNS